MKITNIEIFRFSIPMEPFTIATATMNAAENLLIHIQTDNPAISGWGEGSPFPAITGETQETCVAMARLFATAWMEQNPLEIERRIQQLHDLCAGNYTAKSAFDMALYDIAAKAAGKPLYAYLGGQKKELKTDITIGIGTPEEMSSLASELVSQGANIIKIKLGKGYQQDIERVRQIREKVGDKIILRLDANQGWDFDEARTVLTEVAPYQIQFCEQPMRKHFDYLLPELRKHSSVKIMADESCFVDHDAKRLIRENACDYINIKLAKSGGIHEALKIHHSANEAGIPCMLGAMLESKLAATANLHLACACEGIEFIDQDSFLLGHLEDPVNGGAVYNGFRITMPDIPGIGAEPDPAFLARCGKIVI